MNRLWLVLVEPDPDEAQRVTADQVEAGYAWLERGLRDGYLIYANSYAHEDGSPKTGGLMVAVAQDRPALVVLLSTYPLLDTMGARLAARHDAA